jgi:hypothetical protein
MLKTTALGLFLMAQVPTSDMRIISERVCPMFRSGMTASEVLQSTVNALSASYRQPSRSVYETNTVIAVSLINVAVILGCPEYKHLTDQYKPLSAR